MTSITTPVQLRKEGEVIGVFYFKELMAKRMTDTEKWRDEWFLELEPTMKIFWLYILDTCDCAGVWRINFKLASFSVGTILDKQSALKAFGDRVRVISDDKWWIPKFIAFQYPNGLNTRSNVFKGVMKSLDYHKIEFNPSATLPERSKGDGEGIGNSTDRDMDKNMDKAMDKDMDMDKNSYPKKSEPKSKKPKIESQVDPAIEATASAVGLINQLMGTNYSTTSKTITQFVKKILSDKFTLEDILDVIAFCHRDWIGDEKMAKFITPESILRPTKFESKLERAKNQVSTPGPATEADHSLAAFDFVLEATGEYHEHDPRRHQADEEADLSWSQT